MTYTPTKEELEELGFIEWFENKVLRTHSGNIYYEYLYDKWLFGQKMIYPQSLEDIKTLIKLLTPPNDN